MKTVSWLMAGLLLCGLAIAGVSEAYPAHLSYYFQGLDVDLGTIYTDPTVFIIVPPDPVAHMLQPPANLMPAFDPAVDVFVAYNPAPDMASLVFLPKAADDPARIVAVTWGDVTIPLNVVGQVALADIPAGQPLIFTLADNRQIEVALNWGWGDAQPGSSVPEPGTMLLLGLGLLGGALLFRKNGNGKRLLLLFVLSMVIGGLLPGIGQAGVTTRASVASDGTQGNGKSVSSSISADGRYVAFESVASNLVSGDTNDRYGDDSSSYRGNDVFVHDRQTGETTRISVASDGTEGNGESGSLSISADGRYVAFASLASNLVSGDTNRVNGNISQGSTSLSTTAKPGRPPASLWLPTAQRGMVDPVFHPSPPTGVLWRFILRPATW